jgi:hypothetical protein
MLTIGRKQALSIKQLYVLPVAMFREEAHATPEGKARNGTHRTGGAWREV